MTASSLPSASADEEYWYDVPPLDRWVQTVHEGDVWSAAEAVVDQPAVFARLFRGLDDLGAEPEDLADFAAYAWAVGCDSLLDRGAWRLLFEAAGYRVDDEPAPRPTAPMTLYRGAPPWARANWSWSDVRECARRFALLDGPAHAGLVWRAVVEPDRLLARITPGYAGFDVSEYVVDTDGLAVEPDGLRCGCAVDLEPFSGSNRAAQAALDVHELIECTRPA